MKKSIIFIALFAFVFSFTQIEAAKPVNPGNSSSAKLKTLNLVQLNELQQAAQSIEMTKAEKKSLDKAMVRTLRQGIKGNDVEVLQTILALDPTIYPEGMVTGYFGPLTKKAVTRFQAKYNLTADGIVGLKTKTVLENELDDADLDVEQTLVNGKATWKACGTIPPGHYLAQGWQKNTGIVPLPCDTLPLGIQMNLAKISEIVEGEDEIVAIIDNIVVEDETNTTALISWRTRNERTSSEIHYGTASGTYSIIAEDLSLSNSHEMTLSGLIPDKAYYFVIKAIDKDGNEVVSPQNEFTTDDGSPDTKSPAISGLDVEESNTSTKISWKTDELSNGKVYFSKTSSSDLTTATPTAPNLSLLHTFTLNNLSKGTLYYYKVESFDGAGNKDDETGTFTTLNEAEADNTDPVISGVAPSVNGTSVTITWITNEATIGKFQHSLNKNYTDPVLAPDTISATSHTITLTGLTPDTKYYYKIEATDGSGNTDIYKGTFNIR